MKNVRQNALSVVLSTCRLVVSVIPPLIQLGLIDQAGCIYFGAVIGIVVASMSIRLPKMREPPEGQDLGPTSDLRFLISSCP